MKFTNLGIGGGAARDYFIPVPFHVFLCGALGNLELGNDKIRVYN
jgi:hypothetical protein